MVPILLPLTWRVKISCEESFFVERIVFVEPDLDTILDKKYFPSVSDTDNRLCPPELFLSLFERLPKKKKVSGLNARFVIVKVDSFLTKDRTK